MASTRQPSMLSMQSNTYFAIAFATVLLAVGCARRDAFYCAGSPPSPPAVDESRCGVSKARDGLTPNFHFAERELLVPRRPSWPSKLNVTKASAEASQLLSNGSHDVRDFGARLERAYELGGDSELLFHLAKHRFEHN